MRRNSCRQDEEIVDAGQMSQLAFQAVLADRQIPIHYGVEEFREDIRTFSEMDPGLHKERIETYPFSERIRLAVGTRQQR